MTPVRAFADDEGFIVPAIGSIDARVVPLLSMHAAIDTARIA